MKKNLTLITYLILSIFVALGGFIAWKITSFGLGFYQLIQNQKRFDSLPKPVVLKNGINYFSMKNHAFEIPKSYMQGYARSWQTGAVDSFVIYARIPDFAAYVPKRESNSFSKPERLSAMVFGSSMSKERSHIVKYQSAYLGTKNFRKEYYGEDPIIISTNPRIEYFRAPLGEVFYLIEGELVPQILNCDIQGKSGDPVYPRCNLSIMYDDHMSIDASFGVEYKEQWLEISQKLIEKIKSFERPTIDIPKNLSKPINN